MNLYAGIWKKEFLEYTVREPLSAWSFEVRLSKIAEEYGAKGAVVKDVYNILDVVRKGKLLRSAAKYFNKNPNIYTGHRKINSVYDELKLFVLTVSADIIPIRFQKPIKKIMNRFGYTFFSDELQE